MRWFCRYCNEQHDSLDPELFPPETFVHTASVKTAGGDWFAPSYMIPDDAKQQIHEWTQGQQWPEGTELPAPEKYHVTGIYSPQGFSDPSHHSWIQSKSGMTYPVSTNAVESFSPAEGKTHTPTVLRVHSPELIDHTEQLINEAKERGLPISQFPGGYKPHITVAHTPVPVQLEHPGLSFPVGPLRDLHSYYDELKGRPVTGAKMNKQVAKIGMAETSGFPELDQHVAEYIQAHPELQDLREPANAWGRCQEVSEGLANHLKERGYNAYCTSDELGAFGYKGNQKTEDIGAGDFSYPEHSAVEVYGLYGPKDIRNVTIDLTAAQYGHTGEWPKVHGGPSEHIANPYDRQVCKFIYDPQANHLLMGEMGREEGEHPSHGQLNEMGTWEDPTQLIYGQLGANGYGETFGRPRLPGGGASPKLNPYMVQYQAEEALRRAVPGIKFTNPNEALHPSWELPQDPKVTYIGEPPTIAQDDASPPAQWDFTGHVV